MSVDGQYGEVPIIQQFFAGDCFDKFLVEVGAADGRTHSHTYHFLSKLNWSGILIEPLNEYYKELVSLYGDNDRVQLVNQAVFTIAGEREFVVHGQESRLSEFYVQPKRRRGRKKLPPRERITVQCERLDGILTKYDAPQTIDFLSVDAEGADVHVLRSLDLWYWNIPLICVEHSWPLHFYSTVLAPHGYSVYKRTNGNTFFAK